MSTTQLDQPDPANVYDCALRLTVASSSRPHETHLVDLDCYSMNGRCDCEHFTCRLEPLLARQITPEQAVAQGLVKLKKDQRTEDVLRCKHIVEAYRQFACVAARALSHAKKNTAETPF
jgi:hypothetical protein